MKAKKGEITARSAYKRYTAQFKEQALERAGRDGIPKVAQDLGLARGHCMPGGPYVGKPGNPLKTKNSNRPKWPGSSVKTPGWKREWPSYLCPLGKKGGGVHREVAKVDCMGAGGRATQERLPRSTP